MLSHNNITSIPKEMGEMNSLELIRLANNDISVPLPKEFLTLPKLAWISLAGNPGMYLHEHTTKILQFVLYVYDVFGSLSRFSLSLAGNPVAHVPKTKEKEILKSSVSFDESTILGRGASGTVYLGKHQDIDVAVKIFKQESAGSDGNPEDEAAINALVSHPFAVTAHGVFLSDDAGGNNSHEGMVMELLEGAEALGKPPSLYTCTRDAGPSLIVPKI